MSTTATGSSVQELDDKVNQALLNGTAMDAFDRYYAEDVVMQEYSDEPRVGKAAKRKTEEQFFASVETWNSGMCTARAVNGDVSFTEWQYDITFKGGHRDKILPVAVRRWKDGKIVHERCCYNRAAH